MTSLDEIMTNVLLIILSSQSAICGPLLTQQPLLHILSAINVHVSKCEITTFGQLAMIARVR